MSDSWGGLKGDRGHRLVDRSASRESRSPSTSKRDRSSVESRADRHAALVEDLGITVYGEEDWVLPGMGESAPKCGEYYPEGVCAECGEVHYGSHKCGRRGCPDCWGVWAKERAMSVTERLQMARYAEPDDSSRRLVHVTASVPEEDAPQTKREFYEMWTDAYQLAEEKGVRGGVAVPHAYRVTDAAKDEYEREDPDTGVWVWLRDYYGEDWRDAVYWSPHVHIIGLARDVEAGDPDEDDGWVFKNIRSLERFSLRDEASYEDVYGAVRYLLSHVTFDGTESRQAVRWYGSLSTASFGEAEKPSEGVQSVIERMVEDVAEWTKDDEEGGAGPAEDDEDATPDECRADDCEGQVISVFDVPAYLRRNDPGREIRQRMNLAREWRLGRVRPPPGLKSPRSEEDARETFAVMLEERSW